MSHGLAPNPSWNHPTVMITAFAKSPRVYSLPISAVVFGLIGVLLARRSRKTGGRASLAGAAWRFASAGFVMGALAAAALLGWLVIAWVQWD
jgi:hypothetical protein